MIEKFQVGSELHGYADTNIAPIFSTSKSYKVGDHVLYEVNNEAKLYRFIAAKSAGDWDNNVVVQTISAGDIDTTLSITGMAADAKVTGDAIKAGVGSPLVANTKAAMKDPKHVYVYTGNETGMIKGNWYFYDGSNWVSGGVYNSVAFDTDTTLSVPDMAADAEVVGEALYKTKTRADNTATGFTYFEVTNNFSATNPAGPKDIPINSYCKASGSVFAGFNSSDNPAFTLTQGREYIVIHLTMLSRIKRSNIYIMNAFYKELYVVEFRTESSALFYYDLSPRNYIPLPSDAQPGDYLVYDGTKWVAQAIPQANGVNF